MHLADAHLHLFRQGFEGPRGVLHPRGGELRQYNRLRDKHAIRAGLVIGYEGSPRYAGNNRYLASLLPKQSWMRAVAYCTSQRPISAARLARWRRQGFSGIACYATNAPAIETLLALSAPAAQRLNTWRAAISLNVPIALLARLTPLFTRLGDCRFLLSHLGLPGNIAGLSWRELRGHLRPLHLAASFANTFIKLSGFYACQAERSRKVARGVSAGKLALEWFTPAGALWGSDFSPALHRIQFSDTVDVLDLLEIADSEKSQVAYGNFERLFPSPFLYETDHHSL